MSAVKPETESTAPVSVLDTNDLPMPDRLAAWTDSFNVVFGYTLEKAISEAQFRGRIASTLIDRIMLTRFTASAATYERSAARIGQDGIDMVLVQWYLRGPCTFLDTPAHVRQPRLGDVVVMDMARPMLNQHADQDNLTLCLPRAVLGTAVQGLDEAHRLVLRREQGLTRMLTGHLRSLHRALPHLSLDDAQQLVGPTIELAAAAIRSAGDLNIDDSPALRRAGLQRADAVLETLLREPDVTAEVIAARIPCSRSRLYDLYRDRGGVMHVLRRRRLRAVLAALTHPDYRHRTIQSIAADWCFFDASGFARAFRAEFGISPSEARAAPFIPRAHHSLDVCTPPSGGPRAYEHWVSQVLSSPGA